MSQERGATLWHKAVLGVACAMVLYHMVATQYLIWGVMHHQAAHLGFAVTLVFLETLSKVKRRRFVVPVVALLLAGIFVTGYMLLRLDYLMTSAGFIRSLVDGATGVVLVIVVAEACRQAWGWTLSIVTVIAVVYFFFGDRLPPPFEHAPLQPAFVLSMLGIGFHGIFGELLHISANLVFLFCVFGGILVATGANRFFIEIGKAVGRFVAGGSAQTAVFSSLLVGMVMGGAMTNVILTGTFTIPMMKKAGYKPEQAGAVEASASSGGQFMPPVMGASAFIMAGTLGMAYIDVAMAATIPAVIYFLIIAFDVQLMAVKLKIARPDEKVDTGEILRTGPLFFVPLAIIYGILLMRFTPMYAAFYAIVAVAVIPYLRRDTRVPLLKLLGGFAEGALTGAKIAVALATLGMLVQTFNTTGLGVVVSQVVEEISRGHLWLALVMTMVVSLVLGIGLPTPAAYIIVSIVVAPVLVTMGAPPLAAHFFVFWFAIFSAVTPPVALASMAAAALAGASYARTSLEAIKMCLPAFALPYLMVYGPALILQPLGPLDMALTLLSSIIGLSGLVILLYNHCFGRLNLRDRLLLILGTGGTLSYVFVGSSLAFATGVVVFSVPILLQWKRTRALEQVQAPGV